MLKRTTRWFGAWGSPHLSDESLIELHALLLSGERGVAARYQRHVRQCESCRERLEGLRDACADLRRDVHATVEARITPARLDRQLDVILRRLEGTPGRILPFPSSAPRPAPAPSIRRWVAAAAVAGLVIGIGAGRLIVPADDPVAPWRAASVGPGATVRSGVQPETDEEMLVEIDAALTRSRTKEFRALDELTPRVADARARRR
jgi:hypothetical protein